MRPLKLSITAFGPFIKKEVIDFNTFGESPLFLINGTTGSGKTTILDAICFALYGQTTGKERDASEMRCDFASDDLLTEVEFIFELAGKYYRILRIPEQTRNKSKGEGTTKHSASAELSCYLLDDLGNKCNEELLVARKVSDATSKIEQITGLKVDQFRQVMVLPQGKFRKLLMADSRDREAIFSQLFETHVYKRIEDKLKEQANHVSKRVEELRENQKGILQSVGFEKSSKLEEAIKELEPEVEKLIAEQSLKETHYLDSLKNLEGAKELSQRFLNLEQQENELKLLKDREQEFKEKQQQLQLAETAEKITSDFNHVTKIARNQQESEKQIDELKNVYENAIKSLEIAELDLSKNPERIIKLDQTKEQLLVLQGYESKLEKLSEAQKKNESVQLTFAQVEKEAHQIQTNLDELIKNQKSAISEKESLEKILNENSDFKLDLNVLEDQYQKRKRYDDKKLAIKNLSETMQETVNKGKRLKSVYDEKDATSKELELEWHQAQASILARELKKDQACPVCGSLEHPMPATNKESIPTENQREQAIKDVDNSRQLYMKAREEYSVQNAELKVLDSDIKELQQNWSDISLSSLRDIKNRKETLILKINEHEKQQQKLKDLSQQISHFNNEELKSREAVEKIQLKKSEINAQKQVAIEIVKRVENELPEEFRDLSTLKEILIKLTTEKESLDKKIKQSEEIKSKENNRKVQAQTNLEAQEKILKNISDELVLAKSVWQDALLKYNFANEEAYKKALCDDKIREFLKFEIEDYNKKFQQLTGAIKNQATLLKDKSKPDLNLFTSEFDKAHEMKLTHDQLCKEKSEALNRLKNAETTLLDINKKQITEENEYKIIGTLSNVANGTTGNKISLQRFVLSVILDDVLIDASHRLKIMSKGRYLLLRKEDRSKGNKASGLELEVEDNWTGKVRSVSTLSGGESFMASLSLALGLSSVVQAYAGGIHLNTLFVDEGFGSLDAGSLDEAIRVLTDLRDSGRMIGIISHVSELKEQIPLRLDVKTGDYGSYIELVNS